MVTSRSNFSFCIRARLHRIPATREGNWAGAVGRLLGTPDRIFEFGLERVLDGIGVLIEQYAIRS
jgi:hypothetical protein